MINEEIEKEEVNGVKRDEENKQGEKEGMEG